MKNKLMFCLLLLTGLGACQKQDHPQEAVSDETTEIRSLPPVFTPGGPYPSPMEWAFGNALQAGLPCEVAFAICGVWEPMSPFPGNMNYYTSAPANLEVNSAGDLSVNIDGTKLAPAIKEQALSGAPFVLGHNITLPQSAVVSAFNAAGLAAPEKIEMKAGSYETTVEQVPQGGGAEMRIVHISIDIYTFYSDGTMEYRHIDVFIWFP